MCQIHSFWVRTSFGKFFFFSSIQFLVWALLPEECVHTSTRARVRLSTSSAALHRTCSRRMSLKECVFGCEGKITLYSFPKNPALCEQWMQFVFPEQQQSFTCVWLFPSSRWWIFNKQGPVWCWICTSFETERWSGPSDKRSRSWFGTADGKWNGITFLCFVGNRRASARHSLAPPTARLQELGCFQRES